MTTILILALVLVSTLYLLSILKNRNKNKKINTILDEIKKPIRHGYFTKNLEITNKLNSTAANIEFEPLVYDSNGLSKIEIDKIEPGISNDAYSSEKIKKFIRSGFKSLMSTNDITWLESEESIKEMRRNKLEKLKEVLKGK